MAPSGRSASAVCYALLIPCFMVAMAVLQLVPGDFDFSKSLALQLCDFAWLAAVAAL